jgi:hypothetical protein
MKVLTGVSVQPTLRPLGGYTVHSAKLQSEFQNITYKGCSDLFEIYNSSSKLPSPIEPGQKVCLRMRALILAVLLSPLYQNVPYLAGEKSTVALP